MDALLLYAAEPLQRTLKQDIGPEQLSIARLQREAAARGCDVDDASVTTYIRFGFRLDWLPAVVEALEVPDEVETAGGHVLRARAPNCIPLQLRARAHPTVYSYSFLRARAHPTVYSYGYARAHPTVLV
jgi:hypothetical protein